MRVVSTEPDQSIGHYKVLRELGEGTSGVVQLVRHRPTGRKFAMKSITLGCSDQERKQILIEVRTLHKSDVPGIIAFTNAFYADNAVHIVLEYMDCGSLEGVLRVGRAAEHHVDALESDLVEPGDGALEGHGDLREDDDDAEESL